jgi:hypothetical protein
LWRAYGAFFEGFATAELGALGEGLSDMRRGVESLRLQDLLNFDGLYKIALADVETRAGDPDRTIAILDEALATADRLDYRAFEAELNRTRGAIQGENPVRDSGLYPLASGCGVRQESLGCRAGLLELTTIEQAQPLSVVDGIAVLVGAAFGRKFAGACICGQGCWRRQTKSRLRKRTTGVGFTFS